MAKFSYLSVPSDSFFSIKASSFDWNDSKHFIKIILLLQYDLNDQNSTEKWNFRLHHWCTLHYDSNHSTSGLFSDRLHQILRLLMCTCTVYFYNNCNIIFLTMFIPTHPVGENRSTRKNPTTFGRAWTEFVFTRESITRNEPCDDANFETVDGRAHHWWSNTCIINFVPRWPLR